MGTLTNLDYICLFYYSYSFYLWNNVIIYDYANCQQLYQDLIALAQMQQNLCPVFNKMLHNEQLQLYDFAKAYELLLSKYHAKSMEADNDEYSICTLGKKETQALLEQFSKEDIKAMDTLAWFHYNFQLERIREYYNDDTITLGSCDYRGTNHQSRNYKS